MLNLNKLFDKLQLCLVASIFFDAYCFLYIGTYPVTLFSIISVLFCVASIMKYLVCRSNRTTKESLIAGVMMIYVFINSIITGTYNFASALFSSMYFFIFICSCTSYNDENFNNVINLFQKIMNVMAVYGIYQLIGRFFGLPFTDLIIPGHMVTGFNWGNSVNIFGMQLVRSNALFREPSFFSQYLAINILFYLSRMISAKKTSIRFMVVNTIALICSFSGTGVLLLVLALSIYLLRVRKNNQIISRIAVLMLFAILGIIIALESPLGSYYLQRLSEISVYDPNNFSGYVRLRGGMDVLSAAWRSNPVFGIGIGTVTEYINGLSNYYDGMTVNGFYRVAVEMGGIGIAIWMYFLYRCFIKKGIENSYLIVIQCIIFPMMLCHETFQSNYYWLFIFLLNFPSFVMFENVEGVVHQTANKQNILNLR